MTDGPATYRIFISSPMDVREERVRAGRVIKRLNGEFRGKAKLESFDWLERSYSALEGIQAQIERTQNFDIVVGILWNRVGTPLDAESFSRADGSPYESGTIFEIETALDVAKPRGEPDVVVYEKSAPPNLSQDAKAMKEAAFQRELLEGIIKRWRKAGTATGIKPSLMRFYSPDQFERLLERHLRDWLNKRGIEGSPDSWPIGKSPYPGLQAYDENYARVFFGRRDALDVAWQKMFEAGNPPKSDAGERTSDDVDGTSPHDHGHTQQSDLNERRDQEPAGPQRLPFLLVVGASGAGKSSFARAALLPDLAQPGIAVGVDEWRKVEVTPGTAPLGKLAEALFAALPELEQGDASTPEKWAAKVRRLSTASARVVAGDDTLEAASSVARALERGTAASRETHRLMILVDQLEDVFEAPQPERKAFGEALLELARAGQWVVATFRSDRYAALQDEPSLMELKNKGATYDLLPPSGTDIEAIIRGPARMAGLSFERRAHPTDPAKTEDLADRLLADVGGADALPLLQMALSRLFEEKVKRPAGTDPTPSFVLTFQAYEEMGGLKGAINSYADDEKERKGIARGTDNEEQNFWVALEKQHPKIEAELPAVLLGLAAGLSETGEVVARPATAAELGLANNPLRQKLCAALVKRRLLVVETSASGMVQYRVAHEALLRHWERAKKILKPEHLQAKPRLETALVGWQQAGQSRGELLRGALLASGLGLLKAHGKAVRQELAEFIARSHKADLWRRYGGIGVAAGVLVALTAIGLVLREQTNNLRIAEDRSFAVDAARAAFEARDLLAQGQRNEALRTILSAWPRTREDRRPLSRLLVNEMEAALQSFAISGATIEHGDAVWSATFSPDEQRIVTASEDGTARLWDAVSNGPLGAPMRHASAVWTAKFSADGRRIVTASRDGTARLWDGATGAPLGAPMRHNAGVRYAAFSADGHRVATASVDYTSRLWNGLTGAPLSAPMQHDGPVLAVVFSADGQRVVTASADGTARLWDGTTGAPLGTPMKHDGPVLAVVFSADGQRVVTGSADGTARLWNGTTGAPLGTPMQHEGAVMAAAFSADQQRIVTASEDGTARLWHGTSGAPVNGPMLHQGSVLSAMFAPNGRWIVTSSSGDAAQIWDTTTGTRVGTAMRHDDWVSTAVFSPSGRRIVTASADGTAGLWDGSTGAPLSAQILHHNNRVAVARFSPDGQRIVTASQDGTVQLWDSATGARLGTAMEHDSSVRTAVFSADGERILTLSAGERGAARLWNGFTGAALGAPMQHHGAVRTAVFSADGQRVVTVSEDGVARLWDGATGAPMGTPMQHGGLRTAEFSADGQRILTSSRGGDTDSARLWDGATGAPLGTPMQHGWLRTAAFSGDGQRVVTASGDGTARLWDGTTGALLGATMVHDFGILAAELSADGQRIITRDLQGKVRLWSGATGVPLIATLSANAPVRLFFFTPDGRRIATISSRSYLGNIRDSESLQLWDADTGFLIASSPVMQNSFVHQLIFSPDGRRIITASADNTVRLWDVVTGAQIGISLWHDAVVRAVGFSPDGRRAVTASDDGTVRLWNTSLPAAPNIFGLACLLLPHFQYQVAPSALDRPQLSARSEPICDPYPPPFDPARLID